MNKSLYCIACLTFFGVTLFAAKPCLSQEVAVTGVSFSLRDSNVVVRYNLRGPRDKSYDVVVSLRRKGDPGFRFTPIDISGDAGKGKFEGTDRRIVWHIYKDIPDGLSGDDYYFEITATLLHGGGVSWLYYVGGAALVGGAAAVLYESRSAHGGTGSSPLPQPPGRPY